MYKVEITIKDNGEESIELPSVTARTQNYKVEHKDHTVYVHIFGTYARAWKFYMANKDEIIKDNKELERKYESMNIT